jgi:hypothetical protein
MRYDRDMPDARKKRSRAPRSEGPRTTLRLPHALAVVAERLSHELGISRNDALLRLAARGARLYEEEQAIEQLRAARWAAMVPAEVHFEDDAFPPPGEAREVILASRDAS